MEFKGPIDWHFWGGVHHGYNSEGLVSIDFVAPTFTVDTELTRDCSEAFKWGFDLGLILSQDEYLELINPVKCIRLEVIEEHDELLKRLNDSKIEGNC